MSPASLRARRADASAPFARVVELVVSQSEIPPKQRLECWLIGGTCPVWMGRMAPAPGI